MTVSLFDLGVTLTFLGLIVIIIALIYEIFKNLKDQPQERRGQTNVGGVILIGPFPIVFGNNKDAIKISLILLVATIILILTMAVLSRL
ncbi:MAG: DUF131 domain-containing protein [Sulfolobales archaeon]|nr:DUF131 domain-containing protein [Sulfolobales archaeon]MCG2893352.1 DUF131 domain-containing protein [Sulfolobales archaeon]MCG2910914.1 DUF131 domain-containing protein [Sulfolobales archaeon]